jgi:DivIVA domain-containing protein
MNFTLPCEVTTVGRFTKKMRGYAPAEVDEALRDALAELERQAS